MAVPQIKSFEIPENIKLKANEPFDGFAKKLSEHIQSAYGEWYSAVDPDLQTYPTFIRISTKYYDKDWQEEIDYKPHNRGGQDTAAQTIADNAAASAAAGSSSSSSSSTSNLQVPPNHIKFPTVSHKKWEPQLGDAVNKDYNDMRKRMLPEVAKLSGDIQKAVKSQLWAKLNASSEWRQACRVHAIIHMMELIKKEIKKSKSGGDIKQVDEAIKKLGEMKCGRMAVASFNNIFCKHWKHIEDLKGDLEYNLPLETQVIRYYLAALPNCLTQAKSSQQEKPGGGVNATLIRAQAYYSEKEQYLWNETNERSTKEDYIIPTEYKEMVEVRKHTSDHGEASAQVNAATASRGHQKTHTSSNKPSHGKTGSGNKQEQKKTNPNVYCPNVDTERGCMFKDKCRYSHDPMVKRKALAELAKASASSSSSSSSSSSASGSGSTSTAEERKKRGLCNSARDGVSCKFGRHCRFSHDTGAFKKQKRDEKTVASASVTSSEHSPGYDSEGSGPSSGSGRDTHNRWKVDTGGAARQSTWKPNRVTDPFPGEDNGSASGNNHNIHQATISDTDRVYNAIGYEFHIGVLTASNNEIKFEEHRMTILDTGAQVHITNKAFSEDRVLPVTPIICKGLRCTNLVKTAAKSELFSDPFFIIPETKMDIVSMGCARADYHVSTSTDAAQIVLTHKENSNWVLEFNLENNLYVLDQRTLPQSRAMEMNCAIKFAVNHNTIDTISDKPSGVPNLPKRKDGNLRMDAKLQIFQQIHECLHHPSDSAMETFLDSPHTKNFPITGSDVKLCRNILGKCEDCVLGKAKTITNPLKIIHEPPSRIGEKVVSDIFTIGKCQFIGFWDVFSNMGFIFNLPAKTHAVEKTERVMNEFNKVKYPLTNLVTDHDAVYTNIAKKLPIHVRQRAPGTHESRAERHIQTIQQRVRATLASLPYALPDHLISSLVLDVQNNLNFMPTELHPTPPYSKFYGMPIVFNAHVQRRFGAMVMVNVPINQLDNKNATANRALYGIVIGRDNHNPGMLKMYTEHRTYVAGYITEEISSKFTILQKLGVNSGKNNPNLFNHLFKSHHIKEAAPSNEAEGVEDDDDDDDDWQK